MNLSTTMAALLGIIFFSCLTVSLAVVGGNMTLKVVVGHIGAINAMPKAEAILEIGRKELWKEGILSDDFDLE